MTQFLPPNLLALFAPRDPIPFLPQLEKLPHEKHHNQPYSGIAPFIKHFEVRFESGLCGLNRYEITAETGTCTVWRRVLPSVKWPVGITPMPVWTCRVKDFPFIILKDTPEGAGAFSVVFFCPNWNYTKHWPSLKRWAIKCRWPFFKKVRLKWATFRATFREKRCISSTGENLRTCDVLSNERAQLENK